MTKLISGGIVIAVVAAVASLGVSAQQNQMSFFITSVGSGNGANLGGLAGADKQCQTLAAAAGAGNRTWRAYLSAAAAAGQRGDGWSSQQAGRWCGADLMELGAQLERLLTAEPRRHGRKRILLLLRELRRHMTCRRGGLRDDEAGTYHSRDADSRTGREPHTDRPGVVRGGDLPIAQAVLQRNAHESLQRSRPGCRVGKDPRKQRVWREGSFEGHEPFVTNWSL